MLSVLTNGLDQILKIIFKPKNFTAQDVANFINKSAAESQLIQVSIRYDKSNWK